MQAGRLRRRIVIKQPVEARNGFGDVITTWSTVATVWGSVEPLRGREYMLGQQVQAETTVRIRMRYRSDVLPSWRVVEGAHVYDIKDIVYDPRRREMDLMCADTVQGA